ncbi:hypothetical protein MGYG_04360 [Nannizzia gypsea CBS 118893]|uniref:Uncharacterized protein n=1 Tax=Arthroderma gypseum (strain ATCC MYA-4604 / CBS 118893) TaxID=535722 RepID=E4USK2_ARTGP|nr:hypothetical protein MGYG_04360 [Nannizzia gypsea CBS 118893]EFR01353.1 hypothetical protein MGYG_04360 [Nannizzia gypsea CBS 118893]
MKFSTSLALFMAIASAYAAPIIEPNDMKLGRRDDPAYDGWYGGYGQYVGPAPDDEDYGNIARRARPGWDVTYGIYGVGPVADDENYGNIARRARPGWDVTYGIYGVGPVADDENYGQAAGSVADDEDH